MAAALKPVEGGGGSGTAAAGATLSTPFPETEEGFERSGRPLQYARADSGGARTSST